MAVNRSSAENQGAPDKSLKSGRSAILAGGICMLVAVWIITFCLIIGIGIYAGTKIKSANQS